MVDCKHVISGVVDSRPTNASEFDYDMGMCIRRRRKCTVCGEKFTTYEIRKDNLLALMDEIHINNSSKSAKERMTETFLAWIQSLPDETVDKKL